MCHQFHQGKNPALVEQLHYRQSKMTNLHLAKLFQKQRQEFLRAAAFGPASEDDGDDTWWGILKTRGREALDENIHWIRIEILSACN